MIMANESKRLRSVGRRHDHAVHEVTAVRYMAAFDP